MTTRRTRMLANRDGTRHVGFRCRKCGSCCTLKVPITHHDLRGILEATGASVRDVAEMVPPSVLATPGEELNWAWLTGKMGWTPKPEQLQ